MKVSEQINLGMPILCSKCNQDLFLCQCPQEPFPIPRLPEQNEHQLLLDQIELLKARNESLERLVTDYHFFLASWSEYEIVTIHPGSVGPYWAIHEKWVEQRNVLQKRAEELGIL